MDNTNNAAADLLDPGTVLSSWEPNPGGHDAPWEGAPITTGVVVTVEWAEGRQGGHVEWWPSMEAARDAHEKEAYEVIDSEDGELIFDLDGGFYQFSSHGRTRRLSVERPYPPSR